MKVYTKLFKNVFFLCSFFFFLNASAQAPNKMSYQAVVRNASNALIANSNVGIQISILQTSITGTAVFVERHTTTTNANGLATIEIGGGTLFSGNFTTIDWANGPFFIKTETDPTGGTNYTISGTSQLLSVPFALFAASSGSSSNAWGLNGNAATATSFIGTTNDLDVVFKRNGVLCGSLGNGDSNGSISFGINTLANNTTGFRNTAIGGNALTNNTTGGDNTAIGTGALFANTVGLFNTANGAFALKSNTTGTDNTASGSQALFLNTTGDDNTAMGRGALRNSTTGDDNTAIGKDALFSNTTGSSNTALGHSTLQSNTTADFNTAIGHSTLLLNTTGNGNTAIGAITLSSNTTGSGNTAIGQNALFRNVTGSSNTATGIEALFDNSTGINNTANGKDALHNNTTGTNNVAVGVAALLSNTTGASNVAHGVQALDTNTTGNDNTAIGRAALTDNIIGVSNTAIGKDALFNSLGNNNTALGRGTLSGVTTGSNNTAIGFDAQVPSATNSNQLRLGNTAVSLVSAQVALTVTSDSRWKSNIQKSNLGLDFIKQLNPVSYTRKDVEVKDGKSVISESTSNPSTEYGFIAQELESTLAKFEAKNNGIVTKGDDGMYGVRYNDLIAPMVKAIQEQQAIIDAQSKTINTILKKLELFENKK